MNEILFSPDTAFLRMAFYIGILACIPFGIIGSYVIVKRISYIAGAIAHCVFGGIGLGLYLQNAVGITWFGPMSGAILSAIAAAVTIGLVSLYANQREDTVIGALWAIGMAAGLLFVDRTPGYYDISSFLFGDILLISAQDVKLVLFLDTIVIGLSVLFYNKFLAICFDEEFARIRGINTGFYYILLLCLIALTVVLLIRIVGIVMVVALLTLPAASAGLFAKHLWQMMLLAVGFCILFVWSGLSLSYYTRMPSGPVIIMIAGMIYIGAMVYKKIRG